MKPTDKNFTARMTSTINRILSVYGSRVTDQQKNIIRRITKDQSISEGYKALNQFLAYNRNQHILQSAREILSDTIIQSQQQQKNKP